MFSQLLKPLKSLAGKRLLIISALLILAILITTASVIRSSSITARPLAYLSETIAVNAKTAQPSAEVRKGEIKKTLILDGELRAVKSKTIFADTSEQAKITYLPPEGSIVKAGDRLVELDSGTVLSNIKGIEESLVSIENEMVQMKSQHESTLREMDVELSKLWLAYEQAKIKAKVPPDVVPRREYQENQFILEKSKKEFENQLDKIEQRKKEQTAEFQVKSIDRDKLKVKLDQEKGRLNGMNVRAPSDGMVIYTDHWAERRKVQVGDVVWGGFPVVKLPDLAEMEVLAQVNEVDGPKLSVGQKARIMLDSHTDIDITGLVKDISQTAVKAGWMTKAKIFKVVISMDKTAAEIMKPGMSAQISIDIADYGTQLLVPRSAVKFENGSAKVIRLEEENNLRPVAVTVLYTDPIHFAIADNGALKERDKILLRWD
jgi:HlyD family secretion protein